MRHTNDPEIDEQVELFGHNMRRARQRAGLSQVGLAQASSLDRAAVSFLERAERSPDLRTVLRVAQAVGLAPAGLLAGIGWPPAGDGHILAPGPAPAAGSGRFGVNLRRARTQAGLSQEALAYEANVDRAAISVFERGHRDPNLRTVLKLARALGIAPATLLAGIA